MFYSNTRLYKQMNYFLQVIFMQRKHLDVTLHDASFNNKHILLHSCLHPNISFQHFLKLFLQNFLCRHRFIYFIILLISSFKLLLKQSSFKAHVCYPRALQQRLRSIKFSSLLSVETPVLCLSSIIQARVEQYFTLQTTNIFLEPTVSKKFFYFKCFIKNAHIIYHMIYFIVYIQY